MAILGPQGKRILTWGAAVVALVVAGQVGHHYGLFDKPIKAAVTVTQTLPDLGGKQTPVQGVPQQAVPQAVAQPKGEVAAEGETLVVGSIPWSAMVNGLHANGGSITTKGSLVNQTGLRITYKKYDMYPDMQDQLAAYAKAHAEGARNPQVGMAAAIFMGDAGSSFVNDLHAKVLAVTGQKSAPPSFQIVDILGHSNGEDKCIIAGIPGVRENPQLLRGALVAGVKGDGDINACFNFAINNKIPINPDPTTYDAQAVNFKYVDSFEKADDALIQGVVESRIEVKNGKRTGKKVDVKVNGTATWYPGDNRVAKEYKGYLETVWSTRDSPRQMPATLIIHDGFAKAHKMMIEKLVDAHKRSARIMEGNPQERQRASVYAAELFGGEDAAGWQRAYAGYVMDRDGKPFAIGGSKNVDYDEAADFFGTNGKKGAYKDVWNFYGRLYVSFYPDMLESVPDYSKWVDTSYFVAAAARGENAARAQAATVTFTEGKVKEVLTSAAYQINFRTGSAEVEKSSLPTLMQIVEMMAASPQTKLQVDGHTDSIGDDMANALLSKRRADEVKRILVELGGSAIPNTRVFTRGAGASEPVADNSTAEGRAQNRRVVIKQGS